MNSRELPQNNMDANTKQKIIDQLKSEVETLKAKYLLDKISNNSERNFFPNKNQNNFINKKQSDIELSKSLPKKHEMNSHNYHNYSNFRNFTEDLENKEHIYQYGEDNYLEKNHSVIVDEENENLNNSLLPEEIEKLTIQEQEKNLSNLYPKEYRKTNLNLNIVENSNNLSEKNNYRKTNNAYNYENPVFSQSLKDKQNEISKRDNINNNINNYINEKDKKLSNSYKNTNNNNSIIDYDMFDKAKENLLKIRNDLDELDQYDVNKNRRIYEAIGKNYHHTENNAAETKE